MINCINLKYCLLHLYFYGDKSYQISYNNVTLPYVSKSKMADSTTLTSQNKQFLTLVWVFGIWQLIMLTVKCYGYKIPSTVILKKCWLCKMMKSNRNSYNSTPQQQIKSWYYSMLWDLILWIPLTKKMNPLQWIKISCLPAPFSIG